MADRKLSQLTEFTGALNAALEFLLYDPSESTETRRNKRVTWATVLAAIGGTGASITTGSGAPSGGSQGDAYVRTGSTNPGLYVRGSGGWPSSPQLAPGSGGGAAQTGAQIIAAINAESSGTIDVARLPALLVRASQLNTEIAVRRDGDTALGGRIDAIRQLPTFPASGSRDGKIPKFDGDDLGWEADGGSGGDPPDGNASAYAFRAAPTLTTTDLASSTAIPTSGDGVIFTILNAEEFAGPVIAGSDFFTFWEGFVELSASVTAALCVRLKTTHAFGANFAKTLVHTRDFWITALVNARQTMPMNVFDSVSTVQVGTYGGVTVTEADLALPVRITYAIEVTAHDHRGGSRIEANLTRFDFGGVETLSYQLRQAVVEGGSGGTAIAPQRATSDGSTLVVGTVGVRVAESETPERIPLASLGSGSLMDDLSTSADTVELKAGTYVLAANLEDVFNTTHSTNDLQYRSSPELQVLGTVPSGALTIPDTFYFRGATEDRPNDIVLRTILYLPEDTVIGFGLGVGPGIGQGPSSTGYSYGYSADVASVDVVPIAARSGGGGGGSGGDSGPVAWNDITGKPTFGTAAAADTGTARGNVPVLDGGGHLADAVIPAGIARDTELPSITAGAGAPSGGKQGDAYVRTGSTKPGLYIRGASAWPSNPQLAPGSGGTAPSTGGLGARTDLHDDGSTTNIVHASDSWRELTLSRAPAIGEMIEIVAHRPLSGGSYILGRVPADVWLNLGAKADSATRLSGSQGAISLAIVSPTNALHSTSTESMNLARKDNTTMRVLFSRAHNVRLKISVVPYYTPPADSQASPPTFFHSPTEGPIRNLDWGDNWRRVDPNEPLTLWVDPREDLNAKVLEGFVFCDAVPAPAAVRLFYRAPDGEETQLTTIAPWVDGGHSRVFANLRPPAGAQIEGSETAALIARAYEHATELDSQYGEVVYQVVAKPRVHFGAIGLNDDIDDIVFAATDIAAREYAEGVWVVSGIPEADGSDGFRRLYLAVPQGFAQPDRIWNRETGAGIDWGAAYNRQPADGIDYTTYLAPSTQALFSLANGLELGVDVDA